MYRSLLMPCMVVVALAVVLLLAAGVNLNTVLVSGAVLACPLMMVLMMGGGFHAMRRRFDHDESTPNLRQ